MSDLELLDAIVQKDRDAFRKLYERYWRLFYHIALARTHSSDLSSDITQQFWIDIWTNPLRIQVDEKGCAKNFLYKHFYYCLCDYFKSTAAKWDAETSSLEEEACDEPSYTHIIEELTEKELYALLDEIIAAMPHMAQTVFNARWKENQSEEEIAQQLGVSARTVRLHYQWAISFLRKRMHQRYTQEFTCFFLLWLTAQAAHDGFLIS